ncbi:hypothetical protein M8C21_024795, partial [Ambrosia artemisiifolia]
EAGLGKAGKGQARRETERVARKYHLKPGNIKEFYTLGRELGHGQFGTTVLCVEKSTGNEYACKMIPKRRLVLQEEIEDVRTEIQIMHHMAGHPNVISIVGAYEDAVSVYVVMELCTGGELFDRIIERGHYTEKKAADLSRFIVGVVIAMSLSEEEIAGLKEMFKMMDTDGSNQITLEELKNGLEKVGANIKDAEMTKLMEAADIDNNGTIDYGEFISAMLHLNKVKKEDHLLAAFSYFDKDGSGYITTEELHQACEKFGLTDIPLDEVMDEIDKDNDGRIDYSEFVDMMEESDFGKSIKPGASDTK